MSVSYDVFTEAFLSKVTEYDFIKMDSYSRNRLVDGYMKRAIAEFNQICMYDLAESADDIVREFDIEIPPYDLDEITDIVSEGMIAQWLKPFTYRQDNLENALNTKDFSTYSPAELLRQIVAAHTDARRRFTNMMREYSYKHGDLTDLHL